MIKPDVIVSWPRHMDYPLFRYNLTWMRPYFNEVFIALTQDTLPPDITPWIINSMTNVRFIKPPKSDGVNDWRNLAVRDVLLNFCKAQWVLFLEQDFLIFNEKVLEKIFDATNTYDCLYYQEGERIHPAFALITRENIFKSSLDFSAHPTFDHFYSFFTSLPYTKRAELKELGLQEYVDFKHMAGLSNNYHVFNLGQPFYKPEEFLAYNYWIQHLPLPLSPSFRILSEQIECIHGQGNKDGWIKRFFPKEITEEVK